jgi:rhamnosyltransferase
MAIVVRGRPVEVRTAASWRYYYLFRNRLLLARSYGRRHLWWAVKGFLADYRHLAIVTILAPGRWQRVAAACAGIADGVAGNSGKRKLKADR